MTNVTARAGNLDLPDGIGPEQMEPRNGLRRHASPLSLAVFGAVMLLGLTGLLGHEREWIAEGDEARLTVHSSETIRNGEFFEMRISVDVLAGVDDLVIGVDQALWEDMTVNTMIPAGTDETGTNGEFRFAHGPMGAGTTFLLKVDLQVNPDIVAGNLGTVTVYDGDRPITAAELRITVLP